MSSFLGGLSLGTPFERMGHHFTREFELDRNRSLARFPAYRYYYQGGGDMMLRGGHQYRAQQIPDQYAHLVGEESCCFDNALDAALAVPELRYCEGYYCTGHLFIMNHGWCVAPDGGVVDVTVPTTPDVVKYHHFDTKLPFLPIDRWLYWGVVVHPEFAEAHRNGLGGLPMLPRMVGELQSPSAGRLDFTEPHDFPILKVPYNSLRKDLP